MGASGLGSLLVKEGFLTEQDRLTITKTCGQGSWAFAKSIVAMGLLDEDELAAFFAERTRYQIAPKDFLRNLDQDAVQSFDRRLVSKLEVIPLKRESGKITVGVLDPLDRSTLKQLEFFTGLEVNPVVVPLSQLYEGLSKIDPDFRYQPTALTHFLQNHAQSAWVRQKIDAEHTKEERTAQSRPAIETNPDEELFEEVTEVEEFDDAPIEMEELESTSDDEESNREYSVSDSEETSDEVDPFAGTSETADGEFSASEVSSVSADDEDPFAGLDDAEAHAGDEKADDQNEDFGDTLLDRLNENAPQATMKSAAMSGSDELDTDALFSNAPSEAVTDLDLDADPDQNEKTESGPNEIESETESFAVSEEETPIDDGLRSDDSESESESEGEEAALDSETELTFTADYNMPEVSTFGFEETKPRGTAAMKSQEEQNARSDDLKDELDLLGPDVLDSLEDKEPSLDLAALGHEKEYIDDGLLADLRVLNDNEMPLSKIEGPAFTIDDDSWSSADFKPRPAGFSNDEDTHIMLKPVKRDDSDHDIELFPKTVRESKDAGLNPTSALNEMILRLSLAFTSDAAKAILDEHLPAIGRSGCLMNIKDSRQFVWAKGDLISERLGAAILHPLVTTAEDKRWKQHELKASESWTGSAVSLRIYRDGPWLWAHSLSEGKDSAIFRETVESAVTQAAAKLGDS